jgi:serine/threonine-protein kinase
MPALIGRRYRIEERIGAGNVAVTYRARDIVLKRTVALKMLRAELAADETSLARFAREARAAAAVNHPNVVPIYDYGTHDGQGFLVMAYVTGRTLKQVIAEDGRLAPVDAARLARQLLRGLAAIHAAGIVHRDVKPQNIMVGDDGHARLTDFGIARTDADDRLTSHGTTVGTVAYMAPEQIQGNPVSAATDIYAMGAVVFEMLTGRPPFVYEHPVAVMHANLDQLPPAPSDVVASIPPKLDQIVLRAMAKEPGRRFASANDMVRAFEAAIPMAVSRPQQADASRTSAWLWPLVIALVALIMLGGALAATLGGGSGDQDSTPPPGAQATQQAAALVAQSPTPSPTPRVIRAPAQATAPPLSTITPEPPATEPPATEPPAPTATKTVAAVPTATNAPTLAPTEPPSATSEPRIVPVNNTASEDQTSTVPLAVQFSADEWQGGLYRGDGEWYGRPWTAVYGAQSQYPVATLSFSLESTPQDAATLTITGLDDEWEGNNPIEISVNGVAVFSGPSPFPSWDGIGNGEQAAWTPIEFEVPAGTLHDGQNEIVVANQSPSASVGIPPYVLVSDALLEISS